MAVEVARDEHGHVGSVFGWRDKKICVCSICSHNYARDFCLGKFPEDGYDTADEAIAAWNKAHLVSIESSPYVVASQATETYSLPNRGARRHSTMYCGVKYLILEETITDGEVWFRLSDIGVYGAFWVPASACIRA